MGHEGWTPPAGAVGGVRSVTAPTIVTVVTIVIVVTVATVLTGVTAIVETAASADAGVLRKCEADLRKCERGRRRCEADLLKCDDAKSRGVGVGHSASTSVVVRLLVRLLVSAGGSEQNGSGMNELESAQRTSRARQFWCKTSLIRA